VDKKSLAEMLNALGNEHSLKILAILAESECYVSELAKAEGAVTCCSLILAN